MIKTAVETITPEMARQYLRANTDNYRRISKSTITKYAKDITEGNWQLNGEGIAFDENGKLKNGQHRLAAIIQADKPVDMLVIRGVKENVNIFDSGSNRTLVQIANASGYGEVNSTETAVANAIVGVFNVPTKAQTLNWIEGHFKELHRAYRASGATLNGVISKKMTCVLGAYLMLEAGGMRNYEVELFFRVFNTKDTTGTDGYEPSSALVARKMFDERFPSGTQNRSKYKEQTEIIVKALKDFKDGKERHMNYQIKEPLECLKLLSEIRKADGLE